MESIEEPIIFDVCIYYSKGSKQTLKIRAISYDDKKELYEITVIGEKKIVKML